MLSTKKIAALTLALLSRGRFSSSPKPPRREAMLTSWKGLGQVAVAVFWAT